MQGMVERTDAEANRTRKGCVLNQELGDRPRSDLTLELPPVCLSAAAGIKNCEPLYAIDRAADLFFLGKQNMIFDVEDAGSPVRSFQKFPQLKEVPTFIMGHGGVCDSLE